LAKRGAHIALAARSEEGLSKVAESLRIFNVQTMIASVDLAQPLQCQELVSSVVGEFGTIDILINNAGLETEGPYINLPWEAIDQTIKVNLMAPLYLAYLVIPHMLSQKSGHIVNIASTAGKCGAPYAATYSATKAGLTEWSQALRLELDGTGVQFSTIFPGFITEVGMFAKFGLEPPRLIGSCTPAQVANAVIKAVEKNSLDVIVNSTPLRPLLALRELLPSLGDWFLYKLGVVDFQRRKVGS
jgi:short-subunit dehydrogenase